MDGGKGSPVEVTLRCPTAGVVYSPGDLVPIVASIHGLADPIVEFAVNGTLLARDTSPPFEATFRIGKGERGSKRLVAIAKSPGGQVTRSAPMDIGVGPLDLIYGEMTSDDFLVGGGVLDGQQPLVTLQEPLSGAVLCHVRSVRFVAEVRDGAAPVARVDFEIDGKAIATLTKPPFTYRWEPPTAGRHVAAVRATDAEGRIGVTRRAMLLVIGDGSPDEDK